MPACQSQVGFTAVELDKWRCLTDPHYAPWRLHPRGGCLGTVSDAREIAEIQPRSSREREMAEMQLCGRPVRHRAERS